MAIVLAPKFAIPAIAAAIAAGAGLWKEATPESGSAYGATITQLDASMVAEDAALRFERADFDNSGALDADEYATQALVTAELARVNHFAPMRIGMSVGKVALPASVPANVDAKEREAILRSASIVFQTIASDDRKISRQEFVGAALEQMLASDMDRNGALTGSELSTFAMRQAKAGIAAS
ncbi:MAG: hypothetical protein R3C60_14100 [Parvularculaceae bacterium]